MRYLSLFSHRGIAVQALTPAAQALLARFVADPDLFGITAGKADRAAMRELRRAGLLYTTNLLTTQGEKCVKQIRREQVGRESKERLRQRLARDRAELASLGM